MKVAGKAVVVTGGGNGIGRELAFDLLGRGASVAAVDISEAGLQETASLAAERKDKLSTHLIDITSRDAVESLPSAVIEAHGKVDGLINCAGIIQPFVKLNELEYEAIERVMNVNFWGLLYMTKTFLPYLMDRPSAHIVNISSMGGFLPVPGQTVYGASKAAVKLLTEGLHSELRETSVRVTIAFPGATATNISSNSGVDFSASAGSNQKAPKIKTTEASEAARIIIDAMERDAYRVLVGQDSKMMDWLCRLMPERAAAIIYKQMRSLLPG
ncbi:MAG: SDR family oxidoreductase [Actinobacteria bacterium]|nr:SDR family oxidoreductase [Actinomycetota bacterium]